MKLIRINNCKESHWKISSGFSSGENRKDVVKCVDVGWATQNGVAGLYAYLI